MMTRVISSPYAGLAAEPHHGVGGRLGPAAVLQAAALGAVQLREASGEAPADAGRRGHAQRGGEHCERTSGTRRLSVILLHPMPILPLPLPPGNAGRHRHSHGGAEFCTYNLKVPENNLILNVEASSHHRIASVHCSTKQPHLNPEGCFMLLRSTWHRQSLLHEPMRAGSAPAALMRCIEADVLQLETL